MVEEIWHFQIVMWLQNWNVTCFFETHSCWVSTLLSLGSTGLVKVEIYRVLFVMWPLGRCVMWLPGWDPLIRSHHSAKFGVHRPCKSEDITFFICHVTMILKCHVTLWVGPLILSHHNAKFVVHRSCQSGDIPFFICHVTTISKYHVTLWVRSSHPKWPPC